MEKSLEKSLSYSINLTISYIVLSNVFFAVIKL